MFKTFSPVNHLNPDIQRWSSPDLCDLHIQISSRNSANSLIRTSWCFIRTVWPSSCFLLSFQVSTSCDIITPCLRGRGVAATNCRVAQVWIRMDGGDLRPPRSALLDCWRSDKSSGRSAFPWPHASGHVFLLMFWRWRIAFLNDGEILSSSTSWRTAFLQLIPTHPEKLFSGKQTLWKQITQRYLQITTSANESSLKYLPTSMKPSSWKLFRLPGEICDGLSDHQSHWTIMLL